MKLIPMYHTSNALMTLKYDRRAGLMPRNVYENAIRRIKAKHPDLDTSEYVSPSGGISYGLQYPYRHKEEGFGWVVFSAYDGWVWRRFSLSDERGDYNQQRFWAEKHAAEFCEQVNGIGKHNIAINALHDSEL